MYDRNGDLNIDFEELFQVIKMMVGANIPDDKITEIAKHIIDELVYSCRDLFDRTFCDTDRFLFLVQEKDGNQSISFADFCEKLKSLDTDGEMSIHFLD